jgi:Leucine-rich repeat (LRR) protein
MLRKWLNKLSEVVCNSFLTCLIFQTKTLLMKAPYVILFILTLATDSYIKAQPVNIKDSLALVALYNSTAGKNWYNNTNWLKGPVETWYGITVNNLRVTQINLEDNKLTDSLPNSICNLTALTYFDASNNRITGSIPANIGNLIKLTYLNFYFNKLTGSIPNSIGNLINLETLNFFSNKLSGIIPPSIGNLTRLISLELNSNSLEGSIPASIGNLINLGNFSAFGNNLSGEIPTSITHLKNLSTLDLTSNKLTGQIPDSIGNLTNLYYFSLAGNKLKGKIPASIGNLERLYELHLSYNHLSGSIPESICNLYDLFYVELQYNELSGKIPENLGNLFNLDNIKLNNNELTGHVPASFRNFERLGFFDLSYNDLTGEFIFPLRNKIPYTIYLSHNHFTENKNVMFNWYFDFLGYTLAIDNNDYTFDGIEFLSTRSIQWYYAPQEHLIAHQNNDTLSVYAGGTLKNNTYTWFEVSSHDSVIIVGDSTFHPSKNGQYYAKINNKYAKQLTLITDTINFIKPLINDIDRNILKNKYAITISPNPATNNLHIEGLSSNKTKFTVVDFTGNIKLQAVANNASYNLNIASLTTGNYLLKIETNNNVVTKKFVKD